MVGFVSTCAGGVGGFVGSPSVMWTLNRNTLPPTGLTSTPSQRGVMSPTTRLPPIVLVLIDQGIAVARSVAVAVPSDPISVTFPLTVIPFSNTALANQAKMFPLTVMFECPAVSDGLPVL